MTNAARLALSSRFRRDENAVKRRWTEEDPGASPSDPAATLWPTADCLLYSGRTERLLLAAGGTSFTVLDVEVGASRAAQRHQQGFLKLRPHFRPSCWHGPTLMLVFQSEPLLTQNRCSHRTAAHFNSSCWVLGLNLGKWGFKRIKHFSVWWLERINELR